MPKDAGESGRRFTRIRLETGDFVLPSFQFMAVPAWKPLMADRFRLRYARPPMMALANLLAHPNVGSETMSAPIEGRIIKRTNKDLGRVLALAKLSGLDDYEPWGMEWLAAMEELYGATWKEHGVHLGQGLRELLANPDDLDEAFHTCAMGLLSSLTFSPETLRIAGDRLLGDAIEFVEEKAQG